jgi:hypothetical protein
MEDIKKITIDSSYKKRRFSLSSFLFLIFGCAIIFIGYQVMQISNKVSNIKISDDKMDYVYSKVNDLVNVLNTKEDSGINYNPTEKYDFKPAANEIVAEQQASVVNDQSMKEEIKKMNDSDKLKVTRDKLVDIYQASRQRDEDLAQVKRSFYDTKSLVQDWYNDKKNIKKEPVIANGSDTGIVDKLKSNLNNYIKISKVGEDLSRNGKRILDIDQIPEMLSYAEILLEAGSLSQAAWIMEDIHSITKQEEIFAFTAKSEAFIAKYPNPNAEVQQIKDLIELIENKE